MGNIYIIAGHGAGDPGAIGCGYHEANLTRKIANDIYNKMKNKNVILYPSSKDLYKSKDYNYFTNADYVLEIHFNSAANPSANGTELLIKQGYQPDSTDKAIYYSLTPFFANRGIKKSNTLANMNQFAKRGISYSLLEVCFICNSKDMMIFNQNYNSIINNLVKALGGNEDITLPTITPPASSWKRNTIGWWYQHGDATYTTNNWEYINGHWYHFDSNGYMRTGWYLDKWGVWYYLDLLNGDMKTGWISVHNKWYYLNQSGAMLTNWYIVNQKWYYSNVDGMMLSNQWIGNYWLGSDGAMLVNQWVDQGKYYVGPDGKWVEGKKL